MYGTISTVNSSALCNKWVNDFPDFPYDFSGILGGYGLQHMCSHWVKHRAISCMGTWWQARQSRQRLYWDLTKIVWCRCSCHAVSTDSAWKSYNVCVGSVQRPSGVGAVSVRGMCVHCMIFFAQMTILILAISARSARGLQTMPARCTYSVSTCLRFFSNLS